MNRDFVLNYLGSSSKFVRDNALQAVEDIVRTHDKYDLEIKSLEAVLLEILSSKDTDDLRWEVYCGCLTALDVMVTSSAIEIKDVAQFVTDTDCLRFLHCEEDRLKAALGEFLRALSQKNGVCAYKICAPKIIHLINDQLEEFQSQLSTNGEDVKRINHSQHLQSNAKTLDMLLSGCCSWFDHSKSDENVTKDLKDFISCESETLFELCSKLSRHSEFYVRESAYGILKNMLVTWNLGCDFAFSSHEHLVKEIAALLSLGLSDDDASHTVCLSVCSAFLEFWKFVKNFNTDQYFCQFVPRLCLLRYCLAEGVRLKAAECWKLMVGEIGQRLLEEYINETVEYYLNRLESTWYMTRQASCHAIVELFRKIDKDLLRPFVKNIATTLLKRLKDDLWEVRDSAALVFGESVVVFPVEFAFIICPTSDNNVVDLLLQNLAHDSYLVRSSSAQTLAKILSAYSAAISDEQDNEVVLKIKADLSAIYLKKIKRGLAFEEFESKTALENYEASKPTKSTVDIISKSQWQFADGCIQLIAELASFPKFVVLVFQLIPVLISALYKRDYKEHVILLDTTFKRLPKMVDDVGKQRFKSVLDDFIEPLFYALESDCPPVVRSATDCVQYLSQSIGPSILRAKVIKCNPKYGPKYDSLKEAVSSVQKSQE